MSAALRQLAQLNIARMRYPLDHPAMASFIDQLAWINAVADAAPGFVWRLQTEDGDATAIRVLDDDTLVVNMSVWESLEALFDYVYRSDHRGPLRARRDWFVRMEEPHLVMWWVPAGHRPDLEEAVDRLLLLRREGASPDAFDFGAPFDDAGRPAEIARRNAR